jgi:acylphosphatase
VPRVRIVVQGKVQGVFFRASTRARARSLGLRGWVRNRRDGSVEAVAEGPEKALELWIEFCRRGPPDARVEAMEVYEDPVLDGGDEPEAGGFEVRR